MIKTPSSERIFLPASTMDRKPLKSSKLRAAGFDERLRVMEIEFANGDVYEYKSVSPELYRQLLNSPSPNSFFEDKIEEAFSGKRIGKATKTNADDAFDALFGSKSNRD
jgi:hypothetical protein